MLGTDLLVIVGFSLVHEWLWSRDSGPALSVALFLSMKHAHPADLMDAVERTEDADTMLAVMPRRIGRLIPFDGSSWFGTDPDTMCASLPVLRAATEGPPERSVRDRESGAWRCFRSGLG
jgi:hypothetical protein